MILDAEAELENVAGPSYERLETDEFCAVWAGFLFLRGFAAGRDSVGSLLKSLRRLGAEAALAAGKGSFVLCVLDKHSREIFCCVDPFGLARLFVAGPFVSDDLFALVGALGYDENQLDMDALACFLRFSFYGFGRTIDRRVRFLAGDEIAVLAPGGDHRLLHKKLPDHRSAPEAFDFDAYISDVRIAISGQRVSLDLTGGYDSRLLAACLKDSVVETASTGQPGNFDVAIARRVASAIRLPHVTARHDSSGLEDRARTLLRLTNGQTGILTYDHVHQFTQGRLARGITLVIAGIGGELWKDILWLQDFPFLSGPPRFARLYQTRIEPRAMSAVQLAPTLAAAFEQAREDYIGRMRTRFGSLPRTAAYDCVYAYLRIPFTAGPSVSAGIRMGLPTFCPLYDPEGAAASMRKPPRERLFSRWHRETIARHAPEIATLRTDDGLSARSGFSALADLPHYIGNKGFRAAQKLAQKFGLPDIRHLSLDDPGTLAAGRALAAARPALECLRRLDVIAPHADAVQFSRALFDRLLTAGMTVMELSGCDG
jgi:hypothetical protein